MSFLVFSRFVSSSSFFDGLKKGVLEHRVSNCWVGTAHKRQTKKKESVAAPARLLGFVWFYLLLKYFIYPNEEMAQQRSPRKSLQLNRANTPINVDGPMQDVNVSLSFLLLFIPTLRARAHWSSLSLSLALC